MNDQPKVDLDVPGQLVHSQLWGGVEKMQDPTHDVTREFVDPFGTALFGNQSP